MKRGSSSPALDLTSIGILAGLAVVEIVTLFVMRRRAAAGSRQVSKGNTTVRYAKHDNIFTIQSIAHA